MKNYAVSVTSLFNGNCEIKFVRAEDETEALCKYADYEWVRYSDVWKDWRYDCKSKLEVLQEILCGIDEFLDIKEIPDLIE